MILAIGLGILGLFAMRRAHRRCHGYYHGPGPGPAYGWGGPGGWAGWGGWGGWGDGGWGPPPWLRARRGRWLAHAMLARLDATPAQERAIVGELERLRERGRAARAGAEEARGDLAAALRGTTVDDAALGAALGRLDAATTELRGAAIEALRNVHAVLDARQRAELADLIERRAGWWHRGPYR